MSRTEGRVGWAVLLLLALGATEARGQIAVSVHAGAASYDLAGVGTSGIAAVRVEHRLAPRIDLQAGTGFFWYGTQGDQQVSMLLPEAGLLARPFAGLPLLLGVGAGHTLELKGNLDDVFTLYGAVGLELEDEAGWAVRPELRVRAVDPWAGTIADFTLGVRKRFGAR